MRLKNKTLNAPLTKEQLKRIKKVQLKEDHLAEELFSGMYRSFFKGRGMEFDEVREYQPGDELRSIDWNVTARMGTPFVKVFKEERELSVLFLIDVSRSLQFGTRGELKGTLLSEIAACLSFSGIKNNDKVGLILFSDEIEHYLPARKGIRHVLRLIRDALVIKGDGMGTDLSKALHFVGEIQKKRTVIFLLSDFLFEPDYKTEMSLMANKHELIGVFAEDPLERDGKEMGLITFQDLESGEKRTIDTSSERNLLLQRENFKKNREAHKKLIEKCGASFIQVETGKPFVLPLKKFLKTKRVR